MTPDRANRTPRRVDAQLVPPGWTQHALAIFVGTAATCLYFLWNTAAQGPPEGNLTALLVLLILILWWLVTTTIGIVRYRTWLPSLLAPVTVASSIALLAHDVPENLGWSLSRNALEQVAATCEKPDDARIGLYRIHHVVKRDGGCLFYLRAEKIYTPGLAYFPDAPPPRYSGYFSYFPYRDRWYTFQEGT
ncbi:hypothetical protein ABZ319_34545 [Nocardia sp. NPDC005978]|uniref:hypothetical protein n=1 Tax=Nocardia sp. NPDC005978 TaxID=3156725 RepID=UPI0033A1DA95